MPFPVFSNLQLYPSTNNSISNESVSAFLKSIPKLCEFLAKIDDSVNANGEILACLSNFQDQGIQVKWICKLTDEQFESLGIIKAGWKIALRETSKEYSQ
jgi:hypothetical protein